MRNIIKNKEMKMMVYFLANFYSLNLHKRKYFQMKCYLNFPFELKKSRMKFLSETWSKLLVQRMPDADKFF